MSIYQKCTFCGKEIYRDMKRMNENAKRGWKVYCSNRCVGLAKNKSKEYMCSNPLCGKKFLRTPSDSAKSKCYYCSLRCAALVNNQKYPHDHGAIIKICAYCKKEFKSREKYCSTKCQYLGAVIPPEVLLSQIKEFVKKNGRIPYKWEIGHYHAVRARFGTWNTAIRKAGFAPNPVMFAHKYTAKDGHRCDSLAEKIIDDFLFRKHIKHLRNFPYPGDKRFTVDFKIGEKWIEFFGLSGELKRYDELKKEKMLLAKKESLNLVEIYPRDLFPLNNLSIKLNI